MHGVCILTTGIVLNSHQQPVTTTFMLLSAAYVVVLLTVHILGYPARNKCFTCRQKQTSRLIKQY